MIASKKSAFDLIQALSLEQRVRNYLYHRLPELPHVEFVVCDGTVILRGFVPSDLVRRRCCDCCRHVAGIFNVIDKLIVLPSGELSDANPDHLR